MKKLFLFLTAALFSVGTWAATYSPVDNPATKKYGDITFLDVANTKANGKITKSGATFEGDSTLAYSLRYVGQTLAITTWYNCSDGSPAANFESSPTYADAEINGFVAPSSSSGNIGYGGAKAHSRRIRYFYATGITSVAIISHDNQASKYVQLKIEEVAQNGNLTAVTTIDSPEKSSSTLSLIEYTTALDPTKYYKISCTSNNSSNCKVYQIRFGKYIAPAVKYTVTYKSGEGTGSDVVDDDAKTVKTFATCGFTAPSGYEFKEWQDGSSNVVAEGATVSDNMTLTAIYRLIPTKYTVTYVLNGPSGDAPTETSKAAGDIFTLAAAPSWAGYKFDGWLCSADGLVKAAGASYTMTAAATTFTAQWTEVDCKIYSFTGGIGSALATAAKASVETDRLFLEDSKGRIKLTPASGETFKSGDVISISGYTGNAAKKFSVKVYAANGSTEIGSMSVAAAGDINVLSTTLSADADYIYLARIDGTGQNLTTCEVHRSCAEGTTAGLSYATTEVEKTVGDAAFTNPLTNTNSLIAVYSSSDMTVATVDAKTGQVTVVGEGTTTIMAKSAVQTKSGTLYAVGTATYTLTVNPAPTYTVTYNLNGGTGTLPTQEDQEAGAVFTLHDGTTGITAPENKTFVKWKDQDDNLFNGGAEYTMPAKNVTLTAQWAGDTYTVVYKDGDDELSSEVVEVGSHPIGIEEPTKLYYEFAAWQLSGSDVELDEVTGTKDATITLTVRWAIAYAKSVDFTTSISNLTNYLSENNYFLKSTSGVSLDTSNDFDKGLKMKENNGNTLSFTVPANKRFTLTVGKINGMTIKINDGEATAIPSGTDKDHLGVTYHESYSDQTVIITETSTAYNIIRSIIITDYGVPTALDNTADEAKAVKFIENGQVVIFKDGKYFNVLGIQIR